MATATEWVRLSEIFGDEVAPREGIMAKPQATRLGISKIPLLLSFLCGVLVGVGSLVLYLALQTADDDRPSEIERSRLATDVRAIIQIENEKDIV